MFVAIEGPDGSGKTTICKLLEELHRDDRSWFFTREPCTYTTLGKILRQVVDGKIDLPKEAQFPLFCAARYEHLQLIEQSLARKDIVWGTWGTSTVVTDRYTLSTFVYQTLQGWPAPLVELMCQRVRKPDLTIVLLPTAEELRARRPEMAEQAEAQLRGYTDLWHPETWGQCVAQVETTGRTPAELAKAVSAAISMHMCGVLVDGVLEGVCTISWPLAGFTVDFRLHWS